MFKSIKRSELHALVWSKPMTKAAIDLGISDVGLAKACRRNGVPAPPRGHWAKLAAGKPSPRIPLPRPADDTTIELQVTDRTAREEARGILREKETLLEVKAQSLTEDGTGKALPTGRPHPMVKSTRAFVATIPRLQRQYDRLPPGERWASHVPRPPIVDKGRRFIRAPDGLILTVSDQSTDWAIEMHDRLMRVLSRKGCKFLLARNGDERQDSMVCELNGERVYLSFAEGYRKHVLLADEIARLKRDGSHYQDWIWEPSGRFTWSAVGTEFRCKAQLAGNRSDIEEKLLHFAATCLQLLEDLPMVRAERLESERKRQLEEMERARQQRVAAARKGQVDAAFQLAALRQKEVSVIAYLDELESQRETFIEPFRPKLDAWISVVREELDRRSPYLQALAETVRGPYWRNSPPEWWPDDKTWPDENQSSGTR